MENCEPGLSLDDDLKALLKANKCLQQLTNEKPKKNNCFNKFVTILFTTLKTKDRKTKTEIDDVNRDAKKVRKINWKSIATNKPN